MSQITHDTEVATKADLAEFYQRILPYLNGSSTDYSTTEKVVGTWIDGRPIYQKTFTGSWNIDADKTALIGQIQNLKLLIDGIGSGYDLSGTGQQRLLSSHMGFIYIDGAVGTGAVSVYAHYSTVWTAITIRYTKTTD